MKNNGFTLIELMIVVTIVGILAAIAVPAYGDYVERAKMTEAITLAGAMKANIDEFYKDNGRFPVDNNEAGVPAPDKLLGNYVSSIHIASGAIHATLGHYAGDVLQGKVLSLRPLTVDGSPTSPISWGCGFHEPPPGMSANGENRTDIGKVHLPASCR